jgi:hypothetical protein
MKTQEKRKFQKVEKTLVVWTKIVHTLFIGIYRHKASPKRGFQFGLTLDCLDYFL